MKIRSVFRFFRSPDSAFPADRSPEASSASFSESSSLPFPFPPWRSDTQSSASSNDYTLDLLSIEQIFPADASSEANHSSSSQSVNLSFISQEPTPTSVEKLLDFESPTSTTTGLRFIDFQLPPSRSLQVSASSTRSVSTMASGGEEAVFRLSDASVLKILKGDITRWFVDGSSDAIVNSANEFLLGGRRGSADGAIHRAAGPELKAACCEVPEVRPGIRCPRGKARITPGFNLPASRVIHTVGPVYFSNKNPEESLRNAYRDSLRVAKENDIQYIAFVAISCGAYGYPFDEAAAVAISAVKQFADDLKEVHFVLFFDEIYGVWLNKAKELVQP